ncbi:MAG: DUF6261 family protein [Prevotellaceae bacterium]|jgi:hypothetical protein|nr:DUF6261 family protein [Prevotellaceae bacterium]
MELIRLHFTELWNSEYPLVVNRLIDILGSHELADLHLQGSFDRLAAFRPQLAKIEVQERADRNSALLSECDQQRDNGYSTICNVAKAFKNVPGQSDDAEKLYKLIQKHGSDIPTANYTAETERLFDFVADVERQPELLAALKTLSLHTVFEQLKTANTEFDKLFMQRNKEQAESEKTDVRAIRTACDRSIIALWNAIEFCSAEYGEELYKPLVNAINQLNAYYKQQLAARATRRKNKDVNTEDPITLPEGV